MIDDLKERPHMVYVHYNNYGSSVIDYHDQEGAGKKGTKRNDYRGRNYPPLIGNGRGSGSTISIARKQKFKAKNIKGNYSGDTKTIRLLHELFHPWQASYGEIDYDMVDGLENNERNAVDWENLFRSELRKTPRKEYETNAGERKDVYNKDFKSRAMKKKPKK